MQSGCFARRLVAWSDEIPMSESDFKTNNFYGDTTRKCTVRDSNGRQRTVTFDNDPLEPPATPAL